MNRILAMAVFATTVVGLTATAASAEPDIFGHAEGSQIHVRGATSTSPTEPGVSPASAVAYLRTAQCPNPALGTLDTPDCPNGAEPVPAVICPTGEVGLPPLWTRTADPASTTGWTPWTMIAGSNTCPADPGFPALNATDFQRLPLTPSAIRIEPPTGWTLANVPTIVSTPNPPQTLRTTVLGLGVTVRATPTTFTWNFDDDTTPLTTTDPGHPYPHQSLAHTYRNAGTHHLTLTTQWTGEFLLDGYTTWRPITGTAQTTTISGPLTVYTARPHLVADPT